MTLETLRNEYKLANPDTRYEIKNGALYVVGDNGQGWGIASEAIDGNVYSAVRDGCTVLPLEQF